MAYCIDRQRESRPQRGGYHRTPRDSSGPKDLARRVRAGSGRRCFAAGLGVELFCRVSRTLVSAHVMINQTMSRTASVLGPRC